jgi:hypothetical protein
MAHCNSKPKKMEKGGSTGPIPMPKEIKERRKKRSMKNDKTDALPRSLYKEMGYSDAQLKKMGFKYGGAVKKMANGGCVMSGRGGKFKGVS